MFYPAAFQTYFPTEPVGIPALRKDALSNLQLLLDHLNCGLNRLDISASTSLGLDKTAGVAHSSESKAKLLHTGTPKDTSGDTIEWDICKDEMTQKTENLQGTRHFQHNKECH